VIPNVTWDIKRHNSVAWWGRTDQATPPSEGTSSSWSADDGNNADEDLVQQAALKPLFSIDGPGHPQLPHTAGFRFSYKGKFQEWMEVKIGDDWYVASFKKNWRLRMFIKYDGGTSKWIEDTTKKNEVVAGSLTGWSSTWAEVNEDDQAGG
jgi:hypothetical protein